MSFTLREFWTVIHGMGLGAIFLLAFAGGVAELWNLHPQWTTPAGMQRRLRRLLVGTWTMALAAWLTVLSGTYIVYPWYRAQPPQGAELDHYPRAYLLADEHLAEWHRFGMEWKEHVAWLSPILATAVAYIVWRYGPQLAEDARLRRAVLVLFTLAFLAAAVAGVFGAFITKVAPVH